MLHRTKLAFAAALLLGACATAPIQDAAPAHVAEDHSSSPERGLVSAADPRAAEAGAEMLRQGGSATDAAIATMLALGVFGHLVPRAIGRRWPTRVGRRRSQ